MDPREIVGFNPHQGTAMLQGEEKEKNTRGLELKKLKHAQVRYVTRNSKSAHQLIHT